MNIKSSIAGVFAAVAMVAVLGSAQANCYKYEPGWHMVPKHCDIKHADTWQEYASGVYIQPMVGK